MNFEEILKKANLKIVEDTVQDDKTPLQIMFGELGVTEIEGSEHNPRILQYSKELGLNGILDDETAWCAILLNWCLMKAGKPYVVSALARDISKALYIETDYPVPGDIVLFWRESVDSWKGHVALFLGFTSNGNIWTISGNTSNKVCVSSESSSKVLNFYRV